MTDIDVLQTASDLVVGGREGGREGGMVSVKSECVERELGVIEKELGRI